MERSLLMPNSKSLAVVIVFVFTTAFAQRTPFDPAPAHIVVGPNIQVSRDGDLPHVELTVAANPRNPKQLLGAAITATRPEGGWACKTYSSSDGGHSWFDSSFVEQVEWGGADPQVAFTPNGAAIFANLSFAKDEKGQMGVNLNVYRSEDGGHTWGKPVVAVTRADHPQIAVDQTQGKHHGRIYIAYLHGYPEYQISVIHSDDGGRSFSSPALAATGKGILGINVTSLDLLSDGTLVVPYLDFDFHQQPKPPTEATSSLWVVTSSDGGQTFSQPAKVGSMFIKTEHHLAAFAMFASDTSAGPNRDRIYGVWTDYTSGEGRLTFSYSADRGHTWQRPVMVDSSPPAGSVQYQAQIAVNRDGVVGMTWFDTRASNDLSRYDEYFSASLDGGATFTKPVRVSSETSEMFGPGNMQIIPAAWHTGNTARISFTSPATRWRAGGDYMGLASDSEGTFHALWADSRSGTFQVWSTTIQVGSSQLPRVIPAGISEKDITTEVEIITDPAHYDPATHEFQMPLRLKNLSGAAIYRPIKVYVLKFGSGMGDMLRDYAPEIINGNNASGGALAEFDFSNALGDLEYLAPDAVTEAVTLRLKIGDPEKIPDMHLSVRASTAVQP